MDRIGLARREGRVDECSSLSCLYTICRLEESCLSSAARFICSLGGTEYVYTLLRM